MNSDTTTQTVLFVSHSAGFAGAEKSLLDLVRSPPANVDPIVLVPDSGTLVDQLEEADIEYVVAPYGLWVTYGSAVHLIAIKLGIGFGKTISGIPLAYRKLADRDIDLVYTNTVTSPMGGIIAEFLSVPNVWHVREFIEEDIGGTFNVGFRRTCRLIDKFADHVIYNSEAVKQKYTDHISNTPQSVVYNGPVSRSEAADEPKSILDAAVELCIVGTIIESKGQLEAIQTVHELRTNGVDAHLRIYGATGGEYFERCRSAAAELGVSDHISWEGFVEDIVRAYESADFCLLCSRSEAFGRVVVESMARGCPVIAKRSGGVPELIDDGSDGFLYDDYREIVDIIKSLQDDASAYRSVSTESIETFENRFTRETYRTTVYEILSSVASSETIAQ